MGLQVNLSKVLMVLGHGKSHRAIAASADAFTAPSEVIPVEASETKLFANGLQGFLS